MEKAQRDNMSLPEGDSLFKSIWKLKIGEVFVFCEIILMEEDKEAFSGFNISFGEHDNGVLEFL